MGPGSARAFEYYYMAGKPPFNLLVQETGFREGAEFADAIGAIQDGVR
jgi:hypothetical protein